jgi:membrane-bound serine protease (ClpP class)
MGLAILLFILEAHIASFGLLALGGVVSMLLGALMLIDTPEEYLRIPLLTIVVVVGTTAALFLFIAGAAVLSAKRQPVSGLEGLIGTLGTTVTRLEPTGTVRVRGTLWTARSSIPIDVGEAIRVVRVDGLKLTVERTTEEKAS